MGFFDRFAVSYGKKKIQQGLMGLNDAIVAFDPEGASEAEISLMEEQYDAVNLEFSKARSEWQREEDEAVAIELVYNQRIAACEHIQEQLANDPENDGLNEALNQLITALEEMSPDVERERSEATEFKEILDDIGLTVEMYGTKLKTARQTIKQAMRTMKSAQRKEERAEAKQARAAQQAGLREASSGIGSALEAMQRQASDATARTEAAERKAKLLTPIRAEENDAVKAAMAAVSGAKVAPTSPTDRLAALRRK